MTVASRLSAIPIFQHCYPEITLNLGKLKQKVERHDYLDEFQREPSCRIAGTTTEELQGRGLPEMGWALPLTLSLPLSITPGRWSQAGTFVFLPITVQFYNRFFPPPFARGRAGPLLSAVLAVGAPSSPALAFGLGKTSAVQTATRAIRWQQSLSERAMGEAFVQ